MKPNSVEMLYTFCSPNSKYELNHTLHFQDTVWTFKNWRSAFIFIFVISSFFLSTNKNCCKMHTRYLITTLKCGIPKGDV